MFNLIKAEFKKLFKRKAIYIVFAIAVAYIFLINGAYKWIEHSSLFNEDYYHSSLLKKADEKALKELDENDKDDVYLYISLKSELYVFDYCKNETWRCDYLANNYTIVEQYFDSLYEPNFIGDKDAAKKNLDDLIEKLNKSTFKEMLISEMNAQKEQLALVEEQIKNSSPNEIRDLNEQKLYLASEIAKYEMKIDKNIESFAVPMNNNIEDYFAAKSIVDSINNMDANKITDEDKAQLANSKANMAMAKYNIDNNLNPYEFNFPGFMENFISEYNFIMIIIIVVIAGGIVSDEYHKGTIKQLLLKPYTRTQILTGKLFLILILIPVAFIALFLINFLVCGIFNGFGDIGQGIAVYNYSKEVIDVYDIFTYNIIMFISKLPTYLFVALLTFGLSTVTQSTIVSIIVPLVFNFISNVINLLISSYHIKWLRWFITYIWDFTAYILHNEYTGDLLNSFKFNIVIFAIYILVLIIVPYFVFNHRDIKNV